VRWESYLIQALDVLDVIVDDEPKLVGYKIGRSSSLARTRYERHNAREQRGQLLREGLWQR